MPAKVNIKTVSGLFHTGDFGCVTQEGIVLKGRISQTMNIAGHLVNPQEVEDRLILHPGLQDAAVFSLPMMITMSVFMQKWLRRIGRTLPMKRM